MKDPIERADATETFAELYDIFDDYPNIVKELHKGYDKILAIPSAEKHGEWIDKGWHGDWQFETDGRGNCWHEYECSECGFHSKGSKSNYCPNCGCRMKGTKIVGKHADQMIIDEACMKGVDDEKDY